ncbi:MAG TPA: Lrp/AsnC family transcriptional regulator [Plantibacter sp.]|uniref:Lrp/AsnC family transcriptional regulator n=1 Tax=unclassified Plantibacter TaxID=2624265 RepID=UPI002C0C7C2D|nr:Lrp/AsnC family transcriptional regulator [Plantibacter sp.]
MDELDEQILGILRDHARISFSALGRTIGLSTNAAAARVRKLEQTGIILGYTARLAEDELPGRGGLEVFIDIRLAPGTDHETFLTQLSAIRQVDDAVHLTGPYDSLVHLWVQDSADLDRFLRRLKQDAGVAHSQTRLALRS